MEDDIKYLKELGFDLKPNQFYNPLYLKGNIIVANVGDIWKLIINYKRLPERVVYINYGTLNDRLIPCLKEIKTSFMRAIESGINIIEEMEKTEII